LNRPRALRSAQAVVLIGFVVSFAAAEAAVTVTNRDDQDHTVTIIEGEKRTEHVLKPSQTLTGVCEKGCNLRLDNDDEDDPYLLKPDVAVSIEDGILYYEPDAPAAPQSPASQPRPGSGVKGNKG
jgi:hypothetical protein